MRKLIFTLLLCSSMSAFAQKTNFSGIYLINKTKTDFGKAPETIIPKSIKIEQQADKLTLTRVSLDDQLAEQPAVIEVLSFDGKPLMRNLTSGAVSTTLNWLDDQSFKLVRKGSVTATETWSLVDNGKTLLIDRSVDQLDGFKYEIKCVYDKQ